MHTCVKQGKVRQCLDLQCIVNLRVEHRELHRKSNPDQQSCIFNPTPSVHLSRHIPTYTNTRPCRYQFDNSRSSAALEGADLTKAGEPTRAHDAPYQFGCLEPRGCLTCLVLQPSARLGRLFLLRCAFYIMHLSTVTPPTLSVENAGRQSRDQIISPKQRSDRLPEESQHSGVCLSAAPPLLPVRLT